MRFMRMCKEHAVCARMCLFSMTQYLNCRSSRWCALFDVILDQGWAKCLYGEPHLKIILPPRAAHANYKIGRFTLCVKQHMCRSDTVHLNMFDLFFFFLVFVVSGWIKYYSSTVFITIIRPSTFSFFLFFLFFLF